MIGAEQQTVLKSSNPEQAKDAKTEAQAYIVEFMHMKIGLQKELQQRLKLVAEPSETAGGGSAEDEKAPESCDDIDGEDICG